LEEGLTLAKPPPLPTKASIQDCLDLLKVYEHMDPAVRLLYVEFTKIFAKLTPENRHILVKMAVSLTE
jgi:hypothetical protein